MNNYSVRWSNGTERRYETYEAATAAVLESYPGAEIGHDGDISEGGYRTLCWATEDDSVNDDGAKAVCSIWRDRN
jgi:hypothetical protein